MQVDLYKGLKTVVVVVLALVIVGQPCHICRAFVIIPVAKDLREKEKHFICFVTLHCCFFCIAEFCCCVEANSHFLQSLDDLVDFAFRITVSICCIPCLCAVTESGE